jgi:uncharacterized protein (TIGR02145 family)
MKGLLKPLCVVSLLFIAAGAQASKAVVTQVGGAFKVIPIFTCPEPTQPAEVVSATGRIWLDRNLGAARAAESVNDRCAYGDLYQWGRLTDGHEKRNSGTTTTLSVGDVPGHGLFITNTDWRATANDNLWQNVGSINNNPCPSGFRLPTEAEIIAEISSWSSQDAAGAFASPLKLVTAGGRLHHDGSIVYGAEEVKFGAYWSSTVDGEDVRTVKLSTSSAAEFQGTSRGYGLSVRCIKN